MAISNDQPRGISETWAAPERFQSQKIAQITGDIYSFGLVCVFVVTNGVRPFEFPGGDWKEAITGHCADNLAPAPTSMKPLLHFLEEALVEDPEKRLQSLSEVRQKLLPMYYLDAKLYTHRLVGQQTSLSLIGIITAEPRFRGE